MVRLMIVGAGEAGRMVLREIRGNPELNSTLEVVGFIDDDVSKRPSDGVPVPVYGPISESRKILEREKADQVVVAIPSAGRETMDRIVDALEGAPVQIKIVPGLDEIIKGTVEFRQIRPIRYSDLLGREEVDFDRSELGKVFSDRTVLITGAGGSIGSELVIQLLGLPVRKVVALGHGENSIFELSRRVGADPRYEYVIGDVKDRAKLDREFGRIRPNVVFHSAAHKHVGLMEEFPDEAAANNVLGTYRSAKSAISAGADKFVLISTDKAVKPESVMGMTKKLAEKIVLSLGALQGTTRFVLTRFGNVLGSRGSVATLFLDQIAKGGPLTVTDPEATRYFMSIREASRLVLQSAASNRGEIFVLDMGKPVRILDLAKKIRSLYAPRGIEIPIVFTKLKPGEKRSEILAESEGDLVPTEYRKLLAQREKPNRLFSAGELDSLVDRLSRSLENYDRGALLGLLEEAIR